MRNISYTFLIDGGFFTTYYGESVKGQEKVSCFQTQKSWQFVIHNFIFFDRHMSHIELHGLPTYFCLFRIDLLPKRIAQCTTHEQWGSYQKT